MDGEMSKKNLKRWTDELKVAALPVLAASMAKAAAGQLMAMGVDVRQVPDKKRVGKSAATDWLDENKDRLDDLEALVEQAGVEGFGLMWELPDSLKARIVERLRETFAQDYWEGIAETTDGAVNAVLETGLQEGWSMRDIAEAIREGPGGEAYSRSRAMLIARTESGWALNAARSDAMEDVREAVGDRVPMRRVWLSVLGTTTRATHADLDGVPEDDNGEWELAGVKITAPADPALPVEERANCQCTVTMEFGMQAAEARELIQEYYARQEKAVHRIVFEDEE